LRIFGYEISRAKKDAGGGLSFDRGWWPVRESYASAWQHGVVQRTENVIGYHAVYSCVTLIASDISKIRIRLMEQNSSTGIWQETTSPAFSPVLRKPNRYQNRIKFFEHWLVSKLVHGNTYVLVDRDNRNVITAMYVLDPRRTRPMVAPDGSIFYKLSVDNLSGITEEVVVPASEIIHDVMVPLFHPLCGVSPLTACGLAAIQGLNIQNNSAHFFANGSKPGGLLTAPAFINNETATRLKTHWEENYTGENAGRIAVLGDGLKYEALSVNAVDSQLLEQLKWSAEVVASCYHVPAFMIGVGEYPKHDNIEALQQQYYSQCLQGLIDNIQLSLDEGLGLADSSGQTYGTQFDLDDLLRMDTGRKVTAAKDAIAGGFMTPNEGRAKFNLPPVTGGDSPMLQQQNYSLAALAKRDAQADPFANKTPAAPTANDNPTPASATSGGKDMLALAVAVRQMARDSGHAARHA
jgi:HK97 family phage portal protein